MAERSSLPALAPEHFADFFRGVWGDTVTPFPWQLELLSRVHRERRWPAVVDLPTGTGKTSLIDLAVFLLALGAEEPPAEQWHPRRIAVVVDRRVIVDQAEARAASIGRALAEADDGVLRAVADRLRSLAPAPDGSPSPIPLAHAVLRGGIVRDESWAQRPDRPAVLSSTVDQVGSRLLFRGYGVSRGMRPIHAGLLANDMLYLLDEVHLARPFAETLAQVSSYRDEHRAGLGLPERWQVVRLSATPDEDEPDRFPGHPLEAGGHPVLERRLAARKPVELIEVPTSADPERAHQKLAAEAVRRATAQIRTGAQAVGIIVNRVDTARRAMAAVAADQLAADSYLITGRMRPVDRDQLLSRLSDRITTGRRTRDGGRPVLVIATQSIEAGADFDLDAIVTECASLDALRQRFGRVDRDGMVTAAGSPFTSVILAASAGVADEVIDPVYGTAMRETWRWLQSHHHVDFGINQLVLPHQDRLRHLVPSPSRAPLLLPSHLDRWVCTSEYGLSADPEVALWLHGLDAASESADVSVIWREDIDEALLKAAVAQLPEAETCRSALTGRLNALPPSSTEALAVPASSFRRWVRRQADPELADVWSAAPTEITSWREEPAVLRWRDDAAGVILASAVQPGDTIVVPATWGGLEHGNWNPLATIAVSDVASASATGRRRPTLRLSRALAERLAASARGAEDGQAAGSPPASADEDSDIADGAAEFPDPGALADLPVGERTALVRDYLARVATLTDGAEAALAEQLAAQPSLVLLPFAERLDSAAELAESYVVTARSSGARAGQRPPGSRASAEADLPAEEDGSDGPSFGPRPITLAAHLDGVGRWAERLAGNIGFPPEIARCLALAGRWHDVGKIDPRFQLWLRGGDELLAASSTEPLAKSELITDRRGREQARRRSGYPAGRRHELLSLSLVTGRLDSGPLDDLVLHLVASHHGFGRYRFRPQPAAEDRPVRFEHHGDSYVGSTEHALDRLDSGIPDRFADQTRRWGWFWLAWLEAVLRLADHEDSRHPDVAYEGGA